MDAYSNSLPGSRHRYVIGNVDHDQLWLPDMTHRRHLETGVCRRAVPSMTACHKNNRHGSSGKQQHQGSHDNASSCTVTEVRSGMSQFVTCPIVAGSC
jgi:hypothetical protein